MMKTANRRLTGVPSKAERDYERQGRLLSRGAAAQGMVLLKNKGGILPLTTDRPVALYGAGAVETVKGGSGSGDVNARRTVSIWEGMKEAGFSITSEKWLGEYQKTYREARNAWKDAIWAKNDGAGEGPDGQQGSLGFFLTYSSMPFSMPCGRIPDGREPSDTADTAVYVLSRSSGEGADRHNAPGDYLLTQEEEAFVDALCGMYGHVILVLNTGGLVDLGFMDDPRRANIDAVLYIHQPGMEAGAAFADVISGRVTPCAKLTDTWALSYSDYPNAETFSHVNGIAEKEEYVEGIYVGYRYFDTFEVPARYCFGYGLSYTSFQIKFTDLAIGGVGTEDPFLTLRAQVTNTGETCGSEVVQVYVSCPQGRQPKEFRRLAGFAKTRVLAPGETQEICVRFPLYALASFDEGESAWVMEEGDYILQGGESLEAARVCGMIKAARKLCFAKTQHICPLTEPLTEISQNAAVAASVQRRREDLIAKAISDEVPALEIDEGDIIPKTIEYNGAYDDTPRQVRDFVDTLTVEELILLATGDTAKGVNAGTAGGSDAQLGSAGTSVPGSAAQTSDCAAHRGLTDIVLADGPAGLRLNQSYQVVDGAPVPTGMVASLENGFLLRDADKATTGETYYQFCTAFPAGTGLAQSWDVDLIERVGRAVGAEMAEFNVTLWLAPGMNIHRNPLCGRNFEYYSEDPVVSGLCAAAVTDGVQSAAGIGTGIGTTLKHFACNNQEDNRMGSDSILSERALREIYLKGFEIAVKKSKPMALMTSYNLVNGVHAANSYDLCTKAARNEWGFDGIIMTDWTTTMHGPDCTASGCMAAGNDLVMPGSPLDHEDIRRALFAGTLRIEDLKRSIARLVKTVWEADHNDHK